MHVPPILRDVPWRFPHPVCQRVIPSYGKIAKLAEVAIDGEHPAACRQDVLEDSRFPVASVARLADEQAGSWSNQLNCLSGAGARLRVVAVLVEIHTFMVLRIDED